MKETVQSDIKLQTVISSLDCMQYFIASIFYTTKDTHPSPKIQPCHRITVSLFKGETKIKTCHPAFLARPVSQSIPIPIESD